MTIKVSIVKGFHRNEVVSGIFPLIKPYQEGAFGGFVTIYNPAPKKGAVSHQRVKVMPGDFTLLDEAGEVLSEHVTIATGSGKIETGTNYEQAFVSAETDDDAMERISETFAMLDKITDACAQGVVRGLVVSGPPGIGKSYGVEEQLKKANMFRKIAGQDPKYEVVSGGVSSIGLYQKLYYNRSPEQVLVFDDCDGIMQEEECLNLLKASLNSGDKRRICWNKESRVLGDGEIPNAFDFEGSIVFITNIDFEKTIARGSRIGSHLGAIMSRCHYLDLEIGSMRDKLLRIKQVCKGGMLSSYHFSQTEEEDILKFVVDNSEYMREVSLRAVKKIADFVKMDSAGWLEPTEATLLIREAKFKRLLLKKQEAAKQGLVLADV